MAITRFIKNKENPYLIMNKTSLNDKRLSARAVGILCYILSKPDDWYVNYQELNSRFTEGIFAIKTAVRELILTGYMVKSQFRCSDGKFSYIDFVVFENPQKLIPIKTTTQPLHNKPSTVEPSTVNHTLLSNKITLSNKTTATESSNKSNSSAVAVDNFVKINKNTELVLLLRELKIHNLKKLFALFPFSDIFKYANWVKDKNCRMKNPTGFLITAIKEKWLDNLDADSDDCKQFLFYYKCQKCGKVFAYIDLIRNYDFCNKCGGIH
ncbi:MAG: hypothetical protein GH151_08260 [Bacteroidetes bacterium]|nr:hypothetical protein [Bacteroidota bacterium]